jgi:hypothetical protein
MSNDNNNNNNGEGFLSQFLPGKETKNAGINVGDFSGWDLLKGKKDDSASSTSTVLGAVLAYMIGKKLVKGYITKSGFASRILMMGSTFVPKSFKSILSFGGKLFGKAAAKEGGAAAAGAWINFEQKALANPIGKTMASAGAEGSFAFRMGRRIGRLFGKVSSFSFLKGGKFASLKGAGSKIFSKGGSFVMWMFVAWDVYDAISMWFQKDDDSSDHMDIAALQQIAESRANSLAQDFSDNVDIGVTNTVARMMKNKMTDFLDSPNLGHQSIQAILYFLDRLKYSVDDHTTGRALGQIIAAVGLGLYTGIPYTLILDKNTLAKIGSSDSLLDNEGNEDDYESKPFNQFDDALTALSMILNEKLSDIMITPSTMDEHSIESVDNSEKMGLVIEGYSRRDIRISSIFE